jgi:hypothetical protein
LATGPQITQIKKITLLRETVRGKHGMSVTFARYYRLSTAAVLLGFSGGVLYTLHDAWTYTSVLKRQVQSLWQRGSFLIGGTLMGAGAVLIPGGNDTLILDSLPGLSPHAIPAFVALLFGIGMTLLLMRLLTGKTLKVVCTNDIFRTEN